MVSPRATRWQNRLPHALRLRVSACTESQAHSSRIPCLLRFFIFSAVCTLAYIGGVIPHSRPAPPKPSTRYDLPGGFGRVISSDEAISTRDGISLDSSWDLRDDEVLPGVSHARLAKWRASAARSRLSAAADADTTARATPVDAARADDEASYSDRKGKREGGDELCGWPAPAAPARETEEGFQGDSVWYSTNGSEWMQHGYLEMLLAEMAGRRGGQAGIAGDESEAVCVAVYLPPHWFPCSGSPAGCQLAVWVRPASSDVALLYHLLDTRAFRFLRPSLLPHFRPSAILDAGANIGLASLIFALRSGASAGQLRAACSLLSPCLHHPPPALPPPPSSFPGALIVAVEPARDNFALLQRNVKHLPRILPVNAALWSHDTRIAVTAGRREGFWAYETHASVSVPSLLQRVQLPRFDYVKIDIEGAEKQVFCSAAAAGATDAAAGGWQHDGEVFSLEVHEDLAPGIGACMEGVYPRTRYDVRTYGENTVYFSPHVWVHALKPLDLSVR
ncbi:unnamed protein product [Closterium sp. Naga37s-1]|nr:unnamed protein product [Closterium sp. Naga37s-1]